jgi:hypothetical protein
MRANSRRRASMRTKRTPPQASAPQMSAEWGSRLRTRWSVRAKTGPPSQGRDVRFAGCGRDQLAKLPIREIVAAGPSSQAPEALAAGVDAPSRRPSRIRAGRWLKTHARVRDAVDRTVIGASGVGPHAALAHRWGAGRGEQRLKPPPRRMARPASVHKLRQQAPRNDIVTRLTASARARLGSPSRRRRRQRRLSPGRRARGRR